MSSEAPEVKEDPFVTKLGKPLMSFVRGRPVTFLSPDTDGHYLGGLLKALFLEADARLRDQGMPRDRRVSHFEVEYRRNGDGNLTLSGIQPYTLRGSRVVFVESEAPDPERLDTLRIKFDRPYRVQNGILGFRYVNAPRSLGDPIYIKDLGGMEVLSRTLKDLKSQARTPA